jgi:hypothetical protein
VEIAMECRVTPSTWVMNLPLVTTVSPRLGSLEMEIMEETTATTTTTAIILEDLTLQEVIITTTGAVQSLLMLLLSLWKKSLLRQI